MRRFHHYSWEKTAHPRVEQRRRGARDARSFSAPATSTAIDVPRAFVAVSALAVAAWGIWKLAQGKSGTSQEGTDTTPEPSSTTPGAPPPAPPNVGVGDTVTVKGSFLEKAINFPHDAPFKVLIALPGLSSVTATPAVPLNLPGSSEPFSGAMVIPKEEIVGMTPPAPPGPSPAPPPPGGLVFLGDPLVAKTGKRYRARLQLTGLEASFASPQAIEAKFLALGFDNVRAFKGASSLPGDWPPGEKSGTWFVEGSWNKAPTSMPRPPQIAAAWEA